MVLLESASLPLGSKAPPFTLPDPRSGKAVSLSDYTGNALVLVFMCNHCPYVIHLLDALTQAAIEFADQGVQTVAISSNNVVTHPQDSPDLMARMAADKAFTFPYLYDESQSVAHAYQAVCTPDIYLFDAGHTLYYRGQFDASRPGSGQADGRDLRLAVQALTDGNPPPDPQTPSVGCSIKWKA